MDIHTAAKYMKHGYKVRRASWVNNSEYICEGLSFIESVCLVNDGMTENKRPFHCNWVPELRDLLADDWELILEE